jgi:hypothetical protein
MKSGFTWTGIFEIVPTHITLIKIKRITSILFIKLQHSGFCFDQVAATPTFILIK